MALINTRPVGSDLMKQVMNACCCDKSLRNQVHLPVGLIDGCSSTSEKPLVRVSSMIYPRSSSRWPISLWRWNIWEFNEISFSDGRSLNVVRCVCRVQGKCWAENWRNVRRLRHLLTFCESFVIGRLRRTRKLTERSVTRQSFHLIGKFPESMNCDLHKFDDISSRKHSELVLVDARRLHTKYERCEGEGGWGQEEENKSRRQMSHGSAHFFPPN